MKTLIVAAMALLAVVGGLRARRWIERWRGRRQGVVTDEVMRQIERDGRVTAPEPDEQLDLDHIAKEEQEFWDEERWDQADEY